MSTAKNAINEALASFTRKERDNKSVCYSTSSDGLRDIIREIHCGVFPNGWLFEKCHDLLAATVSYDFDSIDDLEDSRHEIVDGCVDIYNSDLFDWAKRFSEYVDEAKSEGLLTGTEDTIKQLQCGQYLQLDRAWSMLVNGIMAQAESSEVVS
jgi:hypothetical protein